MRKRAKKYGISGNIKNKKKTLKNNENGSIINSEFVPAKTIKEAEEWASRIINGNVSFNGIGLESSNKIVKILEEIKKEFKIIPWSRIQTNGRMKAFAFNKAVMKNGSITNTLVINKNYFKDITSFERKIYNINIKGYFESKNVKDIMLHEYAHSLTYKKDNDFVKMAQLKKVKVDEKDLSTYSQTNYAEYLAESFVAYANKRKISDKAKALFEIFNIL